MLTQLQITALQSKIYNLLMQNPELDMESMGDAQETARDLVLEWIKEHDIDKTTIHYLIQDAANRVVAVVSMVDSNISEFAHKCKDAISEHEVEEMNVRTVEITADGSSGKIKANASSGLNETSFGHQIYSLTKIEIY